ncbi:MAG: hypothetical protein K6T31_00540 [Alicyclobacillus sp.]|nr:hypothetical protein [Alicyclobacillus sp.]
MGWQVFAREGCRESELTRAWFRNHGIPAEMWDVRTVDKPMLAQWASRCPDGVRGLLAESTVAPESTEDLLDWLMAHKEALRTPVVINGDHMWVGYQPERIAAAFRGTKVRPRV